MQFEICDRHRRSPIAENLQCLIREMAVENPTWGEERIANALKLNSGSGFRHASRGCTFGMEVPREHSTQIHVG